MKIFLLISIVFYSCHYRSAMQEETQKIIISNKTFMRTLSFSGEISEKIYCEKCQLNKYQIIITLKDVSPNNIPFSNQSFQPYYSFNSNTRLNISVVKDLYDLAQNGVTIEKRPNSDYLIVGDQAYKFISEERYKWLPN